MPKSTYLATQFLEAALRGSSFTSPVAIYVALYTTAPSIGGGGAECSGLNYARQSVVFAPSVNGLTTNSTNVVFPVASTSWGTIVSYGLLDSLSGGNLLYFTNLSSPKTVLTNDQVMYAVGQLAVIES